MGEDSLLSFPCEFPIKVLGRNVTSFRSAASSIVRAHYGEIGGDRIAEQVSRNGSFLSLTFTVHARSRDEVDTLYAALSAHDAVLLVL